MKLIIPMAGRGSRLRPHTLTVPKPLVPIAGKPIVQRIAEKLSEKIDGGFEEIAFVIGDFGKEAEENLKAVAEALGAKCSIYYQEEPLGPAHAIYCAADSMEGPCMIAFADTLFEGDFDLSDSPQGAIWVKQVEDPRAYGVVVLDDDGYITKLVEKPIEFLSDLAIVGIYYFEKSEELRSTIKHMLDEEITDKGEYQLTSALRILTKTKKVRFESKEIMEWLDCGNKTSLIVANKRVLELEFEKDNLPTRFVKGSCLIQPCYIGKNVEITESIIGPYVSIGDNTKINRSIVENSIIQNSSDIAHVNIKNSMIGNHTKYLGKSNNINIGDYSQLES